MNNLKSAILATLSFGTVSFANMAWINEFHYDNASGDVNEFIEVFVTDTYANLGSLTLSLYNGSDSQLYSDTGTPGQDTFAISTDFTMGDSVAGVGSFYYLALPTNGLQNGSPDGLALSDVSGIIEFLSYEGSFSAIGGPADAVLSLDVGVEELSGAAEDSSLYLTGIGSMASDFSWAVADGAATMGSANIGQTVVPEPSTYAAMIGLLALGFVLYRRRK